MGGINQIPTEIQTNNENSERIIERFRKVINKPEEISTQEEIPVVDKPTPFYENKYVIIGGILILSGLAWYFYDDIKPLGSSILAWINNHRSKPEPSSMDSTQIVPSSSKSKLQSLKDLVYNKIYKKDDDGSNKNSDSIDSIDLIPSTNKGKAVDLDNLSQSEMLKRGLIKPNLTGLKEITGLPENFDAESNAVFNELHTFIVKHELSTFPNETIQEGLYNNTRERLLKLSEANPDLYNKYLNNKFIDKKIQKFIELEKEIFPEELLQENKQERLPEQIKSPASHTYDEIARATVAEQDHWSEKALSPKEMLSPLKSVDPISLENSQASENSSWASDLKRAVKDIVEPHTPKDFPELSPIKQYENEHKVVTDARLDDVERFLEKAHFSDVKENEDLKKVEIDWTESADDYFKVNKPEGVKIQLVKNPVGEVNIKTEDKIETGEGNDAGLNLIKTGIIKDQLGNFDGKEESKTSRMSLLEQINARRNEKDVLPSPVKPKSKELESNSLLEQNNIVSTPSVANVAIAAAVTAYARIEMIEYKILLTKLGINLFYTDTDSIFINKELPDYLIGEALGLMKDELKGGWINKAYFLGIKKYGYLDDKNITHSVFSGVERNSLTWNEIQQISQGIVIIKPSSARFFKNIYDLNISIKDSLLTSILFNPRKKLLNNKYLPIKINFKFLITLDYYLRILKNRIIQLIEKEHLRKVNWWMMCIIPCQAISC